MFIINFYHNNIKKLINKIYLFKIIQNKNLKSSLKRSKSFIKILSKKNIQMDLNLY